MSDYFSRIIQQTGIPIARDTPWAESPRSGAPAAAEFAEALEVDETRVINPPPSSDEMGFSDTAPVEFVADEPVAQSESTDARAGFTVPQPSEAGSTDGIPQQQGESPPDPSDALPAEPLLEVEATVVEAENRPADLREPPEPIAGHADTAAPPVPVEAPPLREIRVERLVEPALPNRVREAASAVAARSSYLRAVREWVAEAPAPGEEVPTGVESGTAEAAASWAESPRPLSAQPVDRWTKTESEMQELVLSIGSISVTVEEPRDDAARAEMPARPARPAAREPELSRVSRHYLRVRK